MTGPLTEPMPDRPAEPVLSVDRLSTMFPTNRGLVHAVSDVSFALHRSETLGIVGESGSGKSVLVRSLMSLNPPGTLTAGRVHLGDRDLGEMPAAEARRVWGGKISMVFQNHSSSLNPVMRIGQQLTETLRLHLGIDQVVAVERAKDLLTQVGIPEPAKRLSMYPHELSGGMRQRVCIAIAIACHPMVLLADEPTTALDVTVQRQILDLLTELRKVRGMGIVLITHDLGVVAHHADRVLVLYGGRIAEIGPTVSIFAEPRHPYTAALLESVPRLSRRSHTRLTTITGQPVDVVDPAPGCRFAARCGRADQTCRSQDPPLVTDKSGLHAFACFHPLLSEAKSDVVPPVASPAAASEPHRTNGSSR